jgi:hypothetical protein
MSIRAEVWRGLRPIRDMVELDVAIAKGDSVAAGADAARRPGVAGAWEGARDSPRMGMVLDASDLPVANLEWSLERR